jgi:hypothetical protein
MEGADVTLADASMFKLPQWGRFELQLTFEPELGDSPLPRPVVVDLTLGMTPYQVREAVTAVMSGIGPD